MSLKPGCRFTVAPRFHIAGDWPRRLLIGSGVDEIDGCFVPRDSWRHPTAEELSILVADREESPVQPHGCVCLFTLPGHLRTHWWKVLDAAANTRAEGQLPGFDSFALAVREMLDFKGMSPPDGAYFGVTVTDPAQRPKHTRHPGGLLGNLTARSGQTGESALPAALPWAVVNLGDSDTSVVLVNRPVWRLLEEMPGDRSDQVASANPAEVAARFLREHRDYPTIRLILEPGQGCRFPDQPMVHDGYLADQQEPDVQLLILRDRPA
jgi:hypothetical protein